MAVEGENVCVPMECGVVNWNATKGTCMVFKNSVVLCYSF